MVQVFISPCEGIGFLALGELHLHRANFREADPIISVREKPDCGKVKLS